MLVCWAMGSRGRLARGWELIFSVRYIMIAATLMPGADHALR